MWKFTGYIMIGVIAIAIGPLMGYRMDDTSDVDSEAILADHQSIDKDHQALSADVAALKEQYQQMNREIQNIESQVDRLSREVRNFSVGYNKPAESQPLP